MRDCDALLWQFTEGSGAVICLCSVPCTAFHVMVKIKILQHVVYCTQRRMPCKRLHAPAQHTPNCFRRSQRLLCIHQTVLASGKNRGNTWLPGKAGMQHAAPAQNTVVFNTLCVVLKTPRASNKTRDIYSPVSCLRKWSHLKGAYHTSTTLQKIHDVAPDAAILVFGHRWGVGRMGIHIRDNN